MELSRRLVCPWFFIFLHFLFGTLFPISVLHIRRKRICFQYLYCDFVRQYCTANKDTFSRIHNLSTELTEGITDKHRVHTHSTSTESVMSATDITEVLHKEVVTPEKMTFGSISHPVNGSAPQEVLLTAQDVISCKGNRGEHPNVYLNGTGSVAIILNLTGEANVETSWGTVYRCSIYVLVEDAHALKIHYKDKLCSSEIYFEVYERIDTAHPDDTWRGCRTKFELLSDFRTRREESIELLLIVKNIAALHSARMEIFSFPRQVIREPTLQLLEISSMSGFVQTPFWNAIQTLFIRSFVSAWVNISVPFGHVMMVSFAQLDIPWKNNQFTIYTGNKSHLEVSWQRGDEKTPPSPRIYESGELFFHYFAKYGQVRLLYSFHKKTSAPQQISEGMWNCSTPSWPQWKLHLLCNLVVECPDARDETDENLCGYTRCHNNKGFSIEGSCYVLKYPHVPKTYHEANVECMEHGGRLASLNPHDEFVRVIGAIKQVGVVKVYVGQRTYFPGMPVMYSRSTQWEDGSMAFEKTGFEWIYDSGIIKCGILHQRAYDITESYPELFECDLPTTAYILCEIDAPEKKRNPRHTIQLRRPEVNMTDTTLVRCPPGHYTWNFQACDPMSACFAQKEVVYGDRGALWDIPTASSCHVPNVTSLPPLFACDAGVQRVPYNLVCDHRSDCNDNSDEKFCHFPQCTDEKLLQCGRSQQCYSLNEHCDGELHCINGADEIKCDNNDNEEDHFFNINFFDFMYAKYPPATVNFKGTFHITKENRAPCNDTHFECPQDGYCLPVYVRCNGVYDCPGYEDEAGCETYTCSGFFRCRGSPICLHPDHVCDGRSHCPEQDDELFCNLRCPSSCFCQGFAFFCPVSFDARLYPRLRYLDAGGSGMSPKNVSDNQMLVHLRLAHCGLNRYDETALPNLISLDLSHNRIFSIDIGDLAQLRNLRFLFLRENPMSSLFQASETVVIVAMPSLRELDLSHADIAELDTETQLFFPSLHVLNLSYVDLTEIRGKGFVGLNQLRKLDMRGCPLISFPNAVWSALGQLQSLTADNYKLCCPQLLPPNFNPSNCQATENPVSSCLALFKDDVHVVFISTVCLLALCGNVAKFVWECCQCHSNDGSDIAVFSTCLSLCDILTGGYLGVVVLMNQVYRGEYLWQDEAWRQGVPCKIIAVVFLTSEKQSLLLLFFIALKHALVLYFPTRRFTLDRKAAVLMCALTWTLSFILGLMSVVLHWPLHSHTALCLPLPLRHPDPAAQAFYFASTTMFHFTLLSALVITLGLISVALNIGSTATFYNPMPPGFTTVKRFLNIAVSRTLFMFPIAVLGILAEQNMTVSEKLAVNVTVYLSPLNSALNPLLYARSIFKEKQQKVQREKLLQRLQAKNASKDQVARRQHVQTRESQ